MKFKKYLKEQSILAQKYPIIASMAKGNFFEKAFNNLLDLLDNYSDEIPNPKHKEGKRWLNRIIEDAFSNKSLGDDWHWAYEIDALPSYFNQMNKALRNVKKHPDSPSKKKWLSIASEIIDIGEKFSKLKPVKKVAVKKETDKERYVKKLASSEAIRIVNKALEELASKIEKDYTEKRIKDIKTKIETYNKADNKQRRNMRSVDYLGIFPFKGDVLLDDKKIRKIAETEAKEVKQAFLVKNVDKLANILQKKGNLKGKPKNFNYKKGSFYGDMEFKFTDGSSFIITNKVITKISQYGKWFNQFPTTFHNVILPDGSKMKQPSEERMIEIFANMIGE